MMAFFLTVAECPAAEATSSQALKSFSAWSIVHYNEYGGNWDTMWNGWLADPQVPEEIKVKGVQDKEDILESVQNLKGQIAAIQEKAAERGKEALEQTRSWLEKLKEATKNEINESLNNAIRGE